MAARAHRLDAVARHCATAGLGVALYPAGLLAAAAARQWCVTSGWGAAVVHCVTSGLGACRRPPHDCWLGRCRRPLRDRWLGAALCPAGSLAAAVTGHCVIAGWALSYAMVRPLAGRCRMPCGLVGCCCHTPLRGCWLGCCRRRPHDRWLGAVLCHCVTAGLGAAGGFSRECPRATGGGAKGCWGEDLGPDPCDAGSGKRACERCERHMDQWGGLDKVSLSR
jgi:hypothetical protein